MSEIRYRGRDMPDPVTPVDTVCITIEVPNAVEYLAAFFGALYPLGQWWYWRHQDDGTECLDCEEAAQLWRTALFQAEENICGGVEPVATNCCGPSITDRLNAITYNNTTQTTYNTHYTQYVTDGNTLVNVAPQMDPNQTSQDGIEQILCLGYQMLLTAIVAQAKGVKNSETAAQSDIIQQLSIGMAGLAGAGGIALGLGGAAATVVTFVGGPWLLLGLALASVGTGIASLFVQADTAMLDDAEAFDAVLCTMRENGIGQIPSFAMFSGLLSPNTFTVGSNAEKLAAIVQPFLSSQEFFVEFMVSMSELYSTDIWAVLPECEVCPVSRERMIYDFTVSQAGWDDPNNGSVYVAGEGWRPNAYDNYSIRILSAPFDVYGATVEMSFADYNLARMTALSSYEDDGHGNFVSGGTVRHIELSIIFPVGTRVGFFRVNPMLAGHYLRKITLWGPIL